MRAEEVWGLQILSRIPVFISHSLFNPFHPLHSPSLASGDVASSPLVSTACTPSWRHWTSCGLLATEKRLKLVFFRAVLGWAGRGHPDRALRINFTRTSSFDKMFEVWQFSYVLSQWPRTALSRIGEQERCKSSAIWHLPVFWLRERWINKSCQRNALQWPWSDRRDSILEKPIICWQRYSLHSLATQPNFFQLSSGSFMN